MTRTEPINYVEATIRALEEDNAELLAEIERLRAALEQVYARINEGHYEAAFAVARAALTAQPAKGEK